tara:strand:- start:3726 stop:4376 length:651 start_codon:yes stop_codon:yes gene_type:complete
MVKNFKLLICFIFSLIIYSNNLFSQTLTPINFVKSATDKISNANNTQFNFRYILENLNEKIRQEIEGKASLSKSYYKISFMGITQLFDGSNIYTIIPENEEITITSKSDESEFDFDLMSMMNYYNDNFDFKYDITQQVESQEIKYVKLTPKKNGDDIKNIFIGIFPDNLNFHKIIQVGINDTQVTLQISNHKWNVNLSEDYFIFDSKNYPNYYINN